MEYLICSHALSCPCSFPDEFESTRIIGDRQFKKALDLFDEASEQLKGKVDYQHTYLDFSQLEVTLPKQGGGGHETVKTCPAAMGFAFAAGKTDGPGAFDFKQGDDKVNVCCNTRCNDCFIPCPYSTGFLHDFHL